MRGSLVISFLSSMGISRVALVSVIAVGAFWSGTSGAEASCVNSSVIDAEDERVLEGTKCDDVIIASDTTEAIDGGGGADVIVGSESVDLIKAGMGDDTIFSNHAHDVYGEYGEDLIYVAGQGYAADSPSPTQARLSMNFRRAPRTSLRPRAFRRLFQVHRTPADYTGNNDPNTHHGGAGNDTLVGNGGGDTLYGDTGDDNISGDSGNDFLAGGHGVDTIQGGPDNDYVRGDGGEDLLTDSSGNDTLSYATGLSPGFNNGDTNPNTDDPDTSVSLINFPTSTSERGVYLDLSLPNLRIGDNGGAKYGGGNDKREGLTGFENIVGTAFSDYIVGTSAANVIFGGGGSDVIKGDDGNDMIYGGASGDNINGEGGTDDTTNGGPGVDYCQGENITSGTCNEGYSGSGHVVPTETSKIYAGYMTQPNQPYGPIRRELYLRGSSASDNIVVVYDHNTGSPDQVHFVENGAGSFSTTTFEDTPGCYYGNVSIGLVSCEVTETIDSIVVTGGSGDDTVTIDNQSANLLPESISPLITGGPEDDVLKGTGYTDDVIVDGGGYDLLFGYNGNDAMLNTGAGNDPVGTDSDYLDAGGGDDLFLSDQVCGQDTLNGGDGDGDNSSWVRMSVAENAYGVHADLYSGGSGEFGHPVSGNPDADPTCGAGTTSFMQHMENLEGSEGIDRLYGNEGPNNLMGHSGIDRMRGGVGSDTLTANGGNDLLSAGDGSDELWAYHEGADDLDCGGGYDHGHSDYSDSHPANCQNEDVHREN